MPRVQGGSARRQTPTTPTKPARVTRSASREPADHALVKETKRRKLKQQTTPKKMRDTNLQTVHEDAATDPALHERDHVDHHANHAVSAEQDADSAKPFEPASNDMFTREQLDSIDREVVVEELPELVRASKNLADMLVASDLDAMITTWENIRTDGHKQQKLFLNRMASVNVHKPSFGKEDYIHPGLLLQALFKTDSSTDVPDGPWRPDNMIYKINLTNMLCNLVPLQKAPSHGTAPDILMALEAALPGTIAGQAFDSQAFDFAVEISKQMCIALLASNPTEDYESIIQYAFFGTNSPGAYKLAQSLHVETVSLSVQQNCQDLLEQTLNDLGVAFAEDGVSWQEAIDALMRTFPWDEFLASAFRYYRHRHSQLNAKIINAGGEDAILEGLAGAIEQRKRDIAAEKMRRRLSQNPLKKSFGASGLAALKARERRNARDSPAASTSAVVVYEEAANEVRQDPTPPAGQIAVDAEIPAALETEDNVVATDGRTYPLSEQLADFANSKRQNAGRQKQRMFADRQSNPQRVTWINDELDTSQRTQTEVYVIPGSSAPISHTSHTSRKRTHDEINEVDSDFEPTQDGGLAPDERVSAADARRRAKNVLLSQRQQSLPSSGQALPSSSNAVNLRPSEDTPPKSSNPGSAIPPALPLSTADVKDLSFAQQSQQAGILKRQGRVAQGERQGPRTPWTDVEVNALNDLILAYGPYWSILKAQDNGRPGGPLLGQRDAEQIRQKARNLKTSWMAAGMDLDKQWDNVALDRKAIAYLAKHGVDYDAVRRRGG